MTFGGGTTVGSARYEVSLDAQAMLQAMAHLEQTTRESSNTVVAALTRIEGENKQVGQASEQMAATVRRSTDEINTATKRASDAHHDFGSILKETTERSLTFFGVGGALELGKKAFEGITTATKEAQQAQFQLNALYRDSAQDVARFSEQLAAATGRSNTEAKEAVATFATLVRNYGFTSEQVKILTERTSDLAAVSGLTFKEAADAVQSAMRGEAEHAERLGLTLNRNAIVAMAQLTDEQKKNYNSLDQLTQAGIIYNEFLRQSSFAQGEAQKRLETAPGAADKLSASMTNLGVRIGEVTGGTGAMQRNLANFIDFVAASIKPLDDLSKAILAIRQAPFNFGFNAGRQLAGQPTLEQEAAQAAEQARAAAEQAPPATTIESLGDPARAAEAKAQRDRARKENLEQQKKDDQALADQVLRNLHEQETATQRTYDSNLQALNHFKEERTRANEGMHQAALDQLKTEVDATKEASDAQIRAAEIAKDRRIAANDESHKATLAQIDAERKAAEEASKGRVQDLEVARNAAFGDVNTVKEQQLAILQAQQEATREARTQEDRDRADARQQEDRDAAAAHQVEVDRLKVEHDTAVEGFKDRRAEIERTKQAALEAIQSETDKETQQHEQALAHLQAEQQAAQATHDQAARALEDQGRALQAQHDSALKVIQAAQQAAQDAHDAAVRAIQAEQQAAQEAHDQRIRQLTDEQTAEERASQARQAAFKAENDELSRQHAQRLSEIDAEAKAEQAALQQQLTALQRQQQGDTFATQQAGLEQKVAQAQTGLQIAQEIAANTGDPNTMLAARKALADAQAALDKALADRQVQIQRDAIQQQIADLKDQVDAKKQAEDDQYQAEKDRITAEIADEQKHLQAVKDATAQQIQAANDQLAALKVAAAQAIQADNDRLAAVKRNLQAQQDAENAAFKQRQDQQSAEKRANDDRLAAAIANLAKERDAENERQKQFAANEASKRKAAEQTATAALGNLQSQSDAEQKAYATATATVNTRYAVEQQRIADTRRVQDRAIADNRTAEDRDLAIHRQAVEDTAKHDHEKIDDLYNNPKTGLIQIEKNALTETLNDFDARKLKADEIYGAEQLSIKATFDDKETGLLPRLAKAWEDQKTNYDLRKGDIDATYKKEKENIYDTFDKDTGDPKDWGLLPKLKKAYDDTKQSLTDQVTAWTHWKEDVVKELDAAIGKVGELIGKVNELNALGGKVVSAPSDINLPDDEQARRDAKAKDDAANQAAIDAAKQAGGRGLYGGSPLSVAQFGPGSAALRTEFGNSNVDAMCGPISAEALARLAGNPQDMATILSWAKSHGYWNPNDGITNSGFGPIADHFGVHTSISGNKQAAIDAIARGEPAVFNTAHHYMLAQGYDPSSGLFDLGYTGETVYNQRYMTFEQLSARGGGFRNIYVADGVNLFGGRSTPAPPSVQKQTISIPALGLNFEISAPVGAAAATSPVTAGEVPPGDVADWISQALAATSKPQSWLHDMMLLAAAESGQRNRDGSVVIGTGDPRARNPQDVAGQNAQGLLQTLPGTFAANVPRDLPADIFNPISNAAAAINYIARTYGNPENTPYWKLHGGTFSTIGVLGYANGGIIPEPTALVSLRNYQPYAIAGEVGPERVVPMGGGRAMGEQIVHNYYGVAPESIVRDLMTAQRRERMLRGRY